MDAGLAGLSERERERALRVRRAQQRKVARQRRLEEKRLKREISLAFCKVLRSELDTIEINQTLSVYTRYWQTERDACARAEVKHKQVMDRKFKARRAARKRREDADRALKEAKERIDEVERLRPIVVRAKKAEKRFLDKTSSIDSVVLHGAPQRYFIERLYKDLHYLYFHLLTGRIASQAEIACLERKLLSIHAEAEKNSISIKGKEQGLAALHGNIVVASCSR